VSLGTAAIAATIAVLFGSVTGHAVVRGSRAARALDKLGMLAFLVPASVLGVGLVAVWNRPSVGVIYTSLAIVAVGFVARYAIAASRACAAGILQTSDSFERAAAVAGASFLRRFWAIVLPMQRRAIAVAWLLVFVLSLRDLETVVLFYPPDGAPLTVRIFTLEANGPEPVVAALALFHLALTLGASVLAGRLLWPAPRRPR
jgi:iron(III) transport system permease protein